MVRIGLDVGGSSIKAGVVGEEYQILSKTSRRTNADREEHSVLDDMAGTIQDALNQAELTLRDVEAVGVGCPGTCNRDTGLIEYANNLGFAGVALCEELKSRLGGIPVYMENDANAAVCGEYLAGSLAGCTDCICVTLGTGVGGGILLNGKIFSGINFAGGELGHMVINEDGVDCNCGRKGCWEMYASAKALVRQTKQAMKEHPESRLWEIAPSLDKVGGRAAFQGARMGDSAAEAVVQKYVYYIGVGLVNLINIFQPEIICLGGGVCNEGDTLITPLRDMILRERYSRYAHRQTKICIAELGNDAGIVGAAFLDKMI